MLWGFLVEQVLDRGELVFIGDVAIELGVHPAKLYAAGCAGELKLQRVGSRWAAKRWEVEAYLARTAEAVTP